MSIISTNSTECCFPDGEESEDSFSLKDQLPAGVELPVQNKGDRPGCDSIREKDTEGNSRYSTEIAGKDSELDTVPPTNGQTETSAVKTSTTPPLNNTHEGDNPRGTDHTRREEANDQGYRTTSEKPEKAENPGLDADKADSRPLRFIVCLSSDARKPYIQDRWGIPKSALNFLDDLLEGFSEADRWFFLHVLHSQLLRKGANRVPVPADVRYVTVDGIEYRVLSRGYRTREEAEKNASGRARVFAVGEVEDQKNYGWQNVEHTRDADPQALEDTGLLRIFPYDRARGLCREYSVPAEIVDQFMEKVQEKMNVKRRYNAFTAKQIRAQSRPKRTKRHDESGNPHPDLIVAAMNAIPVGYFNWTETESFIKDLQDRYNSLHRLALDEIPDLKDIQLEYNDFRNCGDVEAVQEEIRREYGEGSKEFRLVRKVHSARSRWQSALFAFEQIKAQAPKEIANGIYEYQKAWEPQSTGRIGERGGGLQSAPREMKAAARKGVGKALGRPVKNYDLAASHDGILREEFEKAGIQCDWFDRYKTEDGDRREEAAAYVGCSVSTWKRIHHALKQMAQPRKSVVFHEGDGWQEIEYSIWEYLADDEEVKDPDAALERFNTLTADLQRALNEWSDWLAEEWVSENAYRNQYGEFVQNETGAKFNVAPYREGGKVNSEGRRKLAAFRLQGREAYFIHTLTIILKDFEGVTPTSHEHDGLVTVGEIPEEAIEQAKEATGLDYMQLEEKPFA